MDEEEEFDTRENESGLSVYEGKSGPSRVVIAIDLVFKDKELQLNVRRSTSEL